MAPEVAAAAGLVVGVVLGWWAGAENTRLWRTRCRELRWANRRLWLRARERDVWRVAAAGAGRGDTHIGRGTPGQPAPARHRGALPPAPPAWTRRDRLPDWEGSWFGADVSRWPRPAVPVTTPPVGLWAVNAWPSAFGGGTAELAEVLAL